MEIMLVVCKAIVMSTILYGYEHSVLYRCMLHVIEKCHQSRVLAIKWYHLVRNIDVVRTVNCTSTT